MKLGDSPKARRAKRTAKRRIIVVVLVVGRCWRKGRRWRWKVRR